MEVSSDRELEHLGDAQRVVCIRNAYTHYGFGTKTVPVLKGVDMDVSKGCIYGLLGPSGCGKTTLLHCIIGLKKFNSGDVWVFGSRPSLKHASKIGYMPQQISLCNEFTIEESMKFFGWLAGLTTDQVKSRLEFIANLLMLPDVDSKIKDLSGGEQRRVSCATALLHEPELLILDEPTVGLDPILRETIWSHFLSMTKNKSVTIIMTTHYIDEARQADTIGLMRDGTIICQDSPEKLVVRYGASSLDEAFYKVITTRKESEESSRAPFHSAPKEPVPNSERFSHLMTLLWKQFNWMLKNYIFITAVICLSILTTVLYCKTMGVEPKNLNVGLVNYETRHLNCGDLTCNSTHLSCHFVQYLDELLITLIRFESEEEAELSVNTGKLHALVVIRENYTENFKMRLKGSLLIKNWTIEASTIKVVYDNSVIYIAYVIKKHFHEKFQRFAEDYLESCGIKKMLASFPVKFLPPVHGDMRQSHREFISPGSLLLIIFFWSSALTASITMIERKEGILERILVMGVNVTELTSSHFISQFAIMVILCVCQLLLMFPIFHTTLKGSMLLVICFLLMVGTCGMCAGLAISSWSATETDACFLLMGTFLPMVLVSGIFWTLEIMNPYLMVVSKLLPLTVPSESLRNICLKGWSYNDPSVFAGLIVINAWSVALLVISFVGLRLRKI